MTEPDRLVPPPGSVPSWRDEPGQDEAGRRAAYRAWVREHHPDRGGDPTVFAQGLQHWQRALGQPAAGTSPRGDSARSNGTAPAGAVTFHRTRRSNPLTWWQAWRAERARPARVR